MTHNEKTLDEILNLLDISWDSHQELLQRDGFDFQITFEYAATTSKIYSSEQYHALDATCRELITNSFKSLYGRDAYALRKHTPEEQKNQLRSKNARIKFNLSQTERDYLLSVQDNGPGIPVQNYNAVFEYGFSTCNTSGIGLSLAKERMEEMGGRIYFESEVGKGTTFYVELPK